MSVNMPELEGTEKAVALPSGRSHSRIPGMDAVRATAGFQRGMLVAGLVIVLFFTVIAVFARWIAPYGFNDDRTKDGKVFGRLMAPSSEHWFGTTSGGEDVLSRVVFGAETALEVVLLAVLLSIIIGVPLGLISGYFGGFLDRILVLNTDALFAFPSLLLAIIVSIAITGGQSSATGGIVSAAASITVVYVPQYFRVVRNSTVAAREEPYVEAARAIGARPRVIMIRYLFGNVVQSVPVIATLNAGDAILTLAGLGFLGYGIDQSAGAEWGHDLSKAVSDTSNGIWWTGAYPGIAIALLVVGMTLVGESLNDVLNPLLRTAKVTKVVLPEYEDVPGPAEDAQPGRVELRKDSP
jgi:ABC-type dipeptide/oligopeptide/nickel transport system permease subunit